MLETSPSSHGAGDTVTNSSNYVAWGEAASGDLVIRTRYVVIR